MAALAVGASTLAVATTAPAQDAPGGSFRLDGNWGSDEGGLAPAGIGVATPTSPVALKPIGRPPLPFDFEEPVSLWAAESFPAPEGWTVAQAQQIDTLGQELATADMDGNGTADLVSYVTQHVAGQLPDSAYVVVQRTDGFGGVETGMAYPLPVSSAVEGDLDLADVDGDGDIDVVVTSGRLLTIVTLLNDGTGVLASEITTPTAESLDRTITLGDVDGDGVVDLVGLGRTANVARVYLGNGDGSFRPDATLSLTRPNNVALIDADGDGDPEILTVSEATPFLHLWEREADGTWAAVPGAMPATFASATWTGDFDHDGDDDVALLLNCNNFTVLCLRPMRNDDGVFTLLDAVPFQLPNGYGRLDHPHIDGDVVDIDGDGHLDIAIPGRTGEIGVIFGVGDGTFTDWRTVNGVAGWEPALEGGWDADPISAGISGFPQTWGTFAGSVGVVAADLTGDGIIDLASVTGDRTYQRLSGSNSGRLTLVEGTGPREFVGSKALPFTNRNWRSWRDHELTAVADWDGDGRLDLLALVPAGGGRPPELMVGFGTQGGFAQGTPVGPVNAQCTGGTYNTRFLIDDLDGDGAFDLVCGDNNLWLARGDGVGGIEEMQDLGPTLGGTADLFEIAARDLDGDGDLDIVYVASAAFSSMSLGWAENRTGDAGGPPTVAGFAAPQVIGSPDLEGATNIYWNNADPEIADVTSDGLPDLVVTHRTQPGNVNYLSVLVNEGRQPDGTFAFSALRHQTGTGTLPGGFDGSSTELQLLDLDEDGNLDVVLNQRVATTATADEAWFTRTLKGVGNGTFTELQTFPQNGAAHTERRLADLNGDGIADLIEPTNYRSVQLRAGNGDGTFGPPHIFGTPGVMLRWVEPVDIDLDGDLDIVGRIEPESYTNATFAPHNLVILENLGGGTVPDPGSANLEATSLEWLPSTGSASDPLTSVTTGQVRLRVTNGGESPIARPWVDTIWLSDDETISPDDTLVLAVSRTSGLGGGATLDATFDVTLTPHRRGPQHLLVRVDARNDIVETDEADNVTAGAPLSFMPPELALPVGDSASSGEFTSTGGPVIVGIPGATAPLRLTVDGDATAVAVRQGRVPTATVADTRIAAGAGSVVLLPGDYRYVWLDLPDGASATLTLENLPFGVGSVAPVVAGNSGTASFTLVGTGLGRVTGARALPPAGEPIEATSLQANPDGTLAVTFDLTGAALGQYGIEVTDGTATSTLPRAFRVLAAEAGTVRTSLFVPSMARPNGTGAVLITFANDGLSDVVAPIYRVRSRGVVAPADGPYDVGDFTVVASVPGAPVGIIPPGTSGRIEIPFVQGGGRDGLGEDVPTPRGTAFGFAVDEYGPGSIAPYDPAVDYAAELAQVPEGDRDAVVAALTDLLGRNGDSYLRAIHAIRSGLARAGQVTTDLATPRMVAFAHAVAALPGASVQGTLTDESGEPLGWRRVRVQSADDLLHTFTDGQGRFSFRGLADGTAVEVFLDSYGPAPVATPVTPAGGLAVIAPSWAPVVGTVTHADGTPAGGAAVAIVDLVTGAFVNTTARADGTYRFGGVTPGAYTLSAALADGRPAVQDVTVAAEALTIDLSLPAQSTVSGRAVTPTGDPVAGAMVVLSHDESGDALSTTTAADGTFTFTGATPGASTVELLAEGRPRTTAASEVAPGAFDLGDVAFDTGVTVTGTVTDQDGDPVEGVTVGASSGPSGETGAAGTFQLAGVEVGLVTVTAHSEGSLVASVEIDTAVETTADLVLEAAAVVTVRVVGAGGAPVAGAEVSLTSLAGGVPSVVATSDVGTAELRVRPGPYVVATGLFSDAVDLVAGPQTVELIKASSTVTGTLPPTIRPDGVEPSSEVLVWLEHGGGRVATTADASGSFVLEAPAGTTGDIWVYDPYLGVLHRTVSFPAIGQNVDLGVLTSAGATLTIDLPWMTDDAPLVYLSPAGLDGDDRRTPLIPDATEDEATVDSVIVAGTSSLTVRNLPAGQYRVTVLRSLAGGGMEDGIVEFAFSGAATVTPVFPPSAPASGTELLAGTPLSHAFVQLTSAAGVTPARRYDIITGADGSWTHPVAAGVYRVQVWDLATGDLVDDRGQEFPGGAPVPLDVVLASAGPGTGAAGPALFGGQAAPLARPAGTGADALWADPARVASIVSLGGAHLLLQSAPADEVHAPSNAELEAAYRERYWPGDGPAIDPMVQQALNKPYPDQPEDPCLVLDFSALVAAKLAANRAEDTRRMLEAQISEARRQAALRMPEAATRGIIIVNEVINLVTGVKAVMQGAAKKALQTVVVDANERVVQKMADDAAAVWKHTPTQLAELENLRRVRQFLVDFKEGFDATVKIVGSINTALYAADPLGAYDSFKGLVDIAGMLGRLAQDAAVVAAGGVFTVAKELPGPISAIVNLYDQVLGKDGIIVAYQQSIALLENLAKGNAQLRKSYEFDLKRAHDAWMEFQRIGFSIERLSNCPDLEDPSNPPPGPGGPHGPVWGRNFGSNDPNDITGVYGAGEERWVQADSVLSYQIRFENLGPGSNPDTRPPGVPDATAPAAVVDVRLPLDPAVDLSTVAIGQFGFGVGDNEMTFSPPAGAQAFEEARPLELTVPSLFDPEATEDLSLLLRASALLDRDAREVRWLLELVDPATGLVHPNPFAGFLPPEPIETPGAGGGFTTVEFQADDAPTGTTVEAQATIVFDENDPIDTNTWSNRLDRTVPETTIEGDDTTAVGSPVEVVVTDEGSGPGLVDVWRSVDDGPLELWLYRVEPGEIPLEGEVGQRIGLAARSADRVFNLEDVPEEEQLVTVLAAQTDPTGPTTPTNPTVPTDPTSPTSPTVPTDPTGTTDPTDPTGTPDPTDPIDQVGPSGPDGRPRVQGDGEERGAPLPRTGEDPSTLVFAGLLLVASGLALLRRRRV